MTQYAFIYDQHACTGCKTCEMACKDYHDHGVDLAFRKVYDYEGGTCTLDADGIVTSDVFMYHVSCACNHCDNPGCIAATGNDGSIVKDPETGLVLIADPSAINDPQLVIDVCPYDAPRIDPKSGLLTKCDGCHDRVIAGLAPICVEACPLRCIHFVEVDEAQASGYERAAIAPLPEPDLTGPNLWVKPCVNARPSGSDEGYVTNPLEVA